MGKKRVITDMCPVCKSFFFSSRSYLKHIKTTVCGRTPPYANPDTVYSSASEDESESDDSYVVLTTVASSSSESDSDLEIVEQRLSKSASAASWPCPICFRKLDTANQLKLHLSLHRRKRDCFSCYFCKKGVSNADELWDHLGQHTRESAESPAVSHSDKENSAVPSESRQVSTSSVSSASSTNRGKMFQEGGDENINSPTCKICMKQLKHKQALSAHVYRQHTAKFRRMRWCGTCQVTICSPRDFRKHLQSSRHIAKAGASKPAATNERSLLAELPESAAERALDALDSSSLPAIKVERNYQCLNCPKRFVSKSNLRSHNYQQHVARERLIRWCSICQIQVSTPQKFKRHLGCNSHLFKASLQQTSSSARVGIAAQDVGSVPLLHIPAASVSKRRTPNCNICKKPFTTMKYLYMHHNRCHLEEEPDFWYKFRCRQCRAVFGNFDGYRRHQQISHGKRMSTKLPGRMAVSAPSSTPLAHRKRTPSTHRHRFYAGGFALASRNDKKFTCGTCGLKYNSFYSLTKHMNVHQEAFKCCVCGHCSRDEYDLTKHRERHLHWSVNQQ